MKDDAEEWLAKITGTPYIEPKEESMVMESFRYGNPESVYERVQGMRKAAEQRLKKAGKKHG